MIYYALTDSPKCKAFKRTIIFIYLVIKHRHSEQTKSVNVTMTKQLNLGLALTRVTSQKPLDQKL